MDGWEFNLAATATDHGIDPGEKTTNKLIVVWRFI